MGRSGAESRDCRIFCLLSRQGQKRDKKLEVQVFLVRLLALLSFASLPRSCLLTVSTLGLIVGFAIGGAESMEGKVGVGFSRWSRWKLLMSLRRYITAEAGSQVFFFLG